MKLRNKKTDETIDVVVNPTDFNTVRLRRVNTVKSLQAVNTWEYNSLAELNEEWEDYDEPKIKKYWWISPLDCSVIEDNLDWNISEKDDEVDRFNVEIGNYFSTKEEAEKAVEKLKAWKRLRDRYGFAFNGVVKDSKGKFCGVKVKYENEAVTMKEARQAEHDVAILFGGEEQ